VEGNGSMPNFVPVSLKDGEFRIGINHSQCGFAAGKGYTELKNFIDNNL